MAEIILNNRILEMHWMCCFTKLMIFNINVMIILLAASYFMLA